MTILLIILYVIVCLFLIMVVLLQQGKGADLAGAFGGGGSQTSFGPRTGTNLMHRMTTASFVLFVVLSMTLAVLSGKERASVMEDAGAAPEGVVEQVEGEQVMDTAEDAAGETAEQPAAAQPDADAAVDDTTPAAEGEAGDSAAGGEQPPTATE